MHSALYRGRIQHRRHSPVENHFDYSLFMLWLDLDELDRVFASRWLWSTRRPALAWFRRADHFGDPAVSLKTAVTERLREEGLSLSGPVRLLTHLRYFGHVLNPVSFFVCFDGTGESIEHVIAEVTNTPWGERHCYVMSEGAPNPAGGGREFAFAKSFHVSPFLKMGLQYTWRFTLAGDRLLVHNNSYAEGTKIFDATLSMGRREISGPALASALIRQPIVTVKVMVLIYFQAARLWLKKVPFVHHPRRAPRDGSAS